jgi:Zn-dependent M16 (insulinase) family peptidase
LEKKLKINDTLWGFKVNQVIPAPELSATAYILTHIKTEARLLYIDRADENMTFSIAFKTVPTDSSGVFHILEHSVLCGSEKYPLKEPFAELLKSSLKTFLNAMTYSDRTVYPVSSKNKSDFFNLVSVYLDAVFFPLALKNESIFMQEGHRTEILQDGSLSYNGVVFNEMKGAYSSSEEIAEERIDRLLYPDGSYRHDSGGNPSEIVKLTYSDFCESHKKFYTPSNSYTVLDGSVDLDRVLPLIDGYFSRFVKTEKDFELTLGNRVTKEAETVNYESDDKGEKLFLAWRTVPYSEPMKTLALAVLCDAIAGHNGAPLRKRILDTGLCESFNMYHSDGAMEGALKVEARGVKPEAKEELVRQITKALLDFSREGVPESVIEASLNSFEFRARERDFGSYPKGVAFATAALESWIYGGCPMQNILVERIFDKLRKKLGTSFFSDCLLEVIKGDMATLIMVPVREAQNFGPTPKSLTASELSSLRKKLRAFAKWQGAPDTKRALKAIPRLSISDLKEAPRPIPRRVYESEGATVLCHEGDTSGILYFDLYFDVSDLDAEEAYRLFLYSLIIGDMDTRSGEAAILREKIKTNLGSLSVSPTVIGQGGKVKAYIQLTASVLASRAEMLPEIIEEYLLTADFSKTELIRRKLSQINLAFSDAISERGSTYAISRVQSMLDPLSALNEKLLGFSALKNIKRDAFDEDAPGRLSEYFATVKRAYTKKRLTLSYLGDCPLGLVEKIIGIFEDGTDAPSGVDIKPNPRQNEAIVLPTKVGYAALGANILPKGISDLGYFSVLSNILGYELLWNEIRLKGGAYDTGFIHKQVSRLVAMYSYRDPSPVRSLSSFLKTPGLIRSFGKRADNLDGYIISAVGEYDGLPSPRSEAASSALYFLMGRTDEENSKIREAILGFNRDTLLSLADRLEEALKNTVSCLVSSEQMLRESKEGLCDFKILKL